jgi:hypothetical protein
MHHLTIVVSSTRPNGVLERIANRDLTMEAAG